MNQKKFIAVCIIISITAGILGSILSDQLLLPGLYKAFPEGLNKSAQEQTTIIKQPEIVKEK